MGWGRGVGGQKGSKWVKSTKNINFLVLLTPFDLPTPPPNPTFVCLFTFLMLFPTNRSQHFENRMKNNRLRAYLEKLSRICNLSPFQFFSDFLEGLQKKLWNAYSQIEKSWEHYLVDIYIYIYLNAVIWTWVVGMGVYFFPNFKFLVILTPPIPFDPLP